MALDNRLDHAYPCLLARVNPVVPHIVMRACVCTKSDVQPPSKIRYITRFVRPFHLQDTTPEHTSVQSLPPWHRSQRDASCRVRPPAGGAGANEPLSPRHHPSAEPAAHQSGRQVLRAAPHQGELRQPVVPVLLGGARLGAVRLGDTAGHAQGRRQDCRRCGAGYHAATVVPAPSWNQQQGGGRRLAPSSAEQEGQEEGVQAQEYQGRLHRRRLPEAQPHEDVAAGGATAGQGVLVQPVAVLLLGRDRGRQARRPPQDCDVRQLPVPGASEPVAAALPERRERWLGLDRSLSSVGDWKGFKIKFRTEYYI
jgi:hypothetical protein